MAIAALPAARARAEEEPPLSVFGSSEARESALIGILYDLKQTQELKPIAMDIPTYGKVIDEFLSSNWDESAVNGKNVLLANPPRRSDGSPPNLPDKRWPTAPFAPGIGSN